MKIAHMAVITPNRCGLYETARDLVAGLRSIGLDSRLVDPTPDKNPVKHPCTGEDRGAPIASIDWALTADLLINHSGYDNTPLEKATIPVIHICHGRPRSSFISETKGSTPIFSYHYQKNADPRIKAVVTFWEQHVDYHRLMFPDKPVRFVPSPVDLTAWSPDGAKGYGFHGHRGRVNLVLTDAFRDDTDAFSPLHAAGLFAREVEGTRIHIYAKLITGLKGWGAICKRLRDDGSLGENRGWVDGLANAYRAATMMLTPNEIDTRSVREAMACGCPVVRIPTLAMDWRTPMYAALGMGEKGRAEVRRAAESCFDLRKTALAFKAVIDEVSVPRLRVVATGGGGSLTGTGNG